MNHERSCLNTLPNGSVTPVYTTAVSNPPFRSYLELLPALVPGALSSLSAWVLATPPFVSGCRRGGFRLGGGLLD